MELILVLPVLLMVLLALVELGTYLLAAQAIQGAAMAGAREATLPGATSDRVSVGGRGGLGRVGRMRDRWDPMIFRLSICPRRAA